MSFFKTHLRWLAGPLAVVMFLATSGLGTAQAGIVATDEAAHQQTIAADRASLLEALDREDVQGQLEAWGVDADEVKARTGAMSDAEVAQLTAQMDGMPAGEGIVGFVVGVAIIVLVVLLVTDAFDVTDVY